MKVLVTGSSGLIGREVVARLMREGHAVVPFDITDDGSDIRDASALAAAMEGCNGVIHLAAISRVAWGEAAPVLCDDVNIGGTRILLDVIGQRLRKPWLVFASSREVYGDPEIVPVSEDAPMQPVNTYGRSKAEGERMIEAARAKGLSVSVVRLSNVYGTVHDHPDRAVPALLWRSYKGEELRLSGVNAFFDFVHVDDTARGLVMAAKLLQDGAGQLPTVHLSTGVATSLGELARLTLEVAMSRSSVTVLPARSFDVKGFCGNPARAAEVLGWQAEIPLIEGLRRYLEILKKRGRPLDPVEMPALSQSAA